MSSGRISLPSKLFVLGIFICGALAQIFDTGSNGVPPLIFPPPDGLSAACNATFETKINCAPILPLVAWQGYFPTVNDLRALCKPECLQSLGSFRNKQLAACKSDIETVAGEAYPATYNVDFFTFTYNYTCRTDKETKLWCAPQVDQWANEASPAANETCSDCVLGTLQTELNSPFGYDADLVKNFTSMTSSCKSENYQITSPAAYGAAGTATTTSGTVSATPSCSATYTVKDGDDCNKISIAQNVSTSDLLYFNNLEGYCSNFPKAGKKLCLPPQCSVYTVKKDDTCYGITQANKDAFSISQLVSWNANLNRDCSNIDQYVGLQICISFPGELGSGTVETPTTVKAPAPSNVADGTNRNCSRYYTIAPGDYCAYVTLQEMISLPDFYFLNPEVNSTTCANLLLGIAYCVAPVGDIRKYPGYGGSSNSGDPCKGLDAASSCFATTLKPAESWAWPTASATSTPSGGSGPLSLAPGTLNNCTIYDQQFATKPAKGSTYSINSCYAVARFRKISIDQLTSWNPSLKFDSNDPDACELKAGLRYCVSMSGKAIITTDGPTVTAKPTTTKKSPSPTTTSALTGTCSGGVAPPEQTQSGEPCWCQKWVKQTDGKFCGDMASEAGISVEELYALNPPLKNDCSGLFQGYAYCVGPVPEDPKCAGGTKAPEQVQAGISCKCNQWIKQQDGKFCADMAAQAKITTDRLYELNPALKGDCSGLFVGYAYCVGLAP